MDKNKVGNMQNPPHPGQVLWDLCIQPLDITITEAAKGLAVSSKTLSSIINGTLNISPTMAKRLEKAFGLKAHVWLNMQKKYDLWQIEHSDQSYLDNVKDFKAKVD